MHIPSFFGGNTAGCCRVKTLYLYLGGGWFESWPEHVIVIEVFRCCHQSRQDTNHSFLILSSSPLIITLSSKLYCLGAGGVEMNHKNKAVKLKKETYLRRKDKSVQYILPAIGMTIASMRS